MDTLKPSLWMQCNTTVQGFTGRTEADLALPCTSSFPNTRWLRVDSDVLDQLAEYRARRGLTSRDETMHKLLLAAASEATS